MMMITDETKFSFVLKNDWSNVFCSWTQTLRRYSKINPCKICVLRKLMKIMLSECRLAKFNCFQFGCPPVIQTHQAVLHPVLHPLFKNPGSKKTTHNHMCKDCTILYKGILYKRILYKRILYKRILYERILYERILYKRICLKGNLS